MGPMSASDHQRTSDLNSATAYSSAEPRVLKSGWPGLKRDHGHQVDGCKIGRIGKMTRIASLLVTAVTSAILGLTTTAQAQQADMSFFVSSVGSGKGADLGGIAGADAHCQALAKSAGSTSTNWAAYLSTTEPGGTAGIN